MSQDMPTRHPDEEPDYGHPDYSGDDAYNEQDIEMGGITSVDRKFDDENWYEAKRIIEETPQGEDPTGKNIDIRKKPR